MTYEPRLPLQVLVVEDNPGDARLLQEVFQGANENVALHVAQDGLDAMAFLRQQGSYRAAPRPSLILLDLNLPKMDGRAVLAHIKADPDLKTIPTVILTTSEAPEDIAASFRLQANCYLNKPVELDEFEQLVKHLNDFWLSKTQLPSVN